jgi:hypothetical protein
VSTDLIPSPAPGFVAEAADRRPALPALFAPTPKATRRVLEFFTAQINSDHTRVAYMNATRRFAQWSEDKGRPRAHRHSAVPRRRVRHGTAAAIRSPDRQAAPGGAADAVRLADDRPRALITASFTAWGELIREEVTHIRELVPLGRAHFRQYEHMVRVIFNYLFNDALVQQI